MDYILQHHHNHTFPGFQPHQQYGSYQSYEYQGLRSNNQQGYGFQEQGFNHDSQEFANQHYQGYPVHENQPSLYTTQQAPPQNDLVTMMQQLLSGQSDLAQSTTALTNRIISMEDEIQQLKRQRASISQHGQLPGTAEANPRTEYIMAIELRSGTTLPSRVYPNEDIVHQKGGVDLVDEEVFVGDPYSESLAREYAIEEALRKEKELEELKAREATQAKKPKYVPPPPYVPPLPYPGRFKKQATEEIKVISNKSIKKVEITMPLVDALVLVPQQAKLIKDTDNEKSIMEIEMLLFGSHEYDLMDIDKDEGATKVEIQPSKIEYMGGYSSFQIASPQKQEVEKKGPNKASTLSYGNYEAMLALGGHCVNSHLSLTTEEEVKDAKGGFYTTNLEKTSDAPFFLFGPSTGSMRVTPWKFDNGSIAHKMKNKKKAKPFAKVKAMLTSELKEKGKGELQRIIDKVAEHLSKKPPWSAPTPNLSIN